MFDDALEKALEDYENRNISMASYAKSGVYNFANMSICEQYKDLPLVYMEMPQTEKYKKLIYEVAMKIWKTPEYIKLAKEGKTYFVMASHVFGNLCSGAIFHEKGVFYTSLSSCYVPKEKIKNIETDNKSCIFITDYNDVKHYLPVMDSKKVKQESVRFLSLLRCVYNLS